MRRIAVMAVVALLGAVAGATASTLYLAVPNWVQAQPTQIMAAPPCGGWWPSMTHSITPFVRHDEIWLLVHCEDGRVYTLEAPNQQIPVATTNGG